MRAGRLFFLRHYLSGAAGHFKFRGCCVPLLLPRFDLLSPLKSPTATALGFVPAEKFAAGVKLGMPLLAREVETASQPVSPAKTTAARMTIKARLLKRGLGDIYYLPQRRQHQPDDTPWTGIYES